MAWGFIEGKNYNRRQDIHERFNGQRQGGIITPANNEYPIFIISSQEGNNYGYTDYFLPNGNFEYCGEGQKGDMQMVKGNLKIFKHQYDQRDLLLFIKQTNGLVKYIGQFICESYSIKELRDINNQPRQSIVFNLFPCNQLINIEENIIIDNIDNIDINILRENAKKANNNTPNYINQTNISIYQRSKAVYAYVIARARGICEYCNKPAPFLRQNNSPYLEVHHIFKLSDGGPDNFNSMIAICPNCHKESHFGKNRKNINKEMERIVLNKENSTS